MNLPDPPADAIPRGMTTRDIIDSSKVALSTLNRWVAQGLVGPSLMGGAGQRFARYWSARDLVLVRIVKALREAGCPLHQVKEAQHTLREIWGTDLAGVVLYWDGTRILAGRWDEVYSLIREPGQSALLVVAASVAIWKHEAEQLAVTPVNVQAIQQRRREYRERNPKERTPTQQIGFGQPDEAESSSPHEQALGTDLDEPSPD